MSQKQEEENYKDESQYAEPEDMTNEQRNSNKESEEYGSFDDT